MPRSGSHSCNASAADRPRHAAPGRHLEPAKLFPPPRFGNQSPEVSIENGTIEFSIR